MPEANVLKFTEEETKAIEPNRVSNYMYRLGVDMVPFTPVPFTGPSSINAYLRLAAYAGLSYMTYKQMRPLSYIFMGSAGFSLMTSIMAGVKNNMEKK